MHVCGGRGAESRKTPGELRAIGDRSGLDSDALARASRLVAKVDSAAVQDGYDLYLHGFVVGADGRWAVVQQGMHGEERMARRYHWLSDRAANFVDAPHTAIDGPPRPTPIVNLTDSRAADARTAQLAIVREGPDSVARAVRTHGLAWRSRAPAPSQDQIRLPFHHDVRPEDILGRRLYATVAAAHERAPVDFADLLLVPGVGARTVFALALVGEVVYGAPSRFSDPARFSLAHGGKDGHPYPVPLRVYDQTIRVLKTAVTRAKIGNDDRLSALRRLDAEARRVERAGGATDVGAFIADERSRSPTLGGRTATRDKPVGPTAGTNEELPLSIADNPPAARLTAD